MLLSLRRLSSKPIPVVLNTETIGEGGRPLIVLHGLFGHIQNWRSVGKALASKLRRRIVLTDLRNHGSSPWKETMTYDEMAEDVAEVARRVGDGERVDILGHSMGGKTAMEVVDEYPDLFDKVIVEDVAPRRYTANVKLFRQYIGGMRSLDLTKPKAHLSKDLEKSIPEKEVRDFILTNITTREGRNAWRVNLDAISPNLDHLLGMSRLEGVYPRPALFLHGGASNYLLPSDHTTILKHFPLAKIEAIPEAGHWVHAQKPALFIASVDRFLHSS